MTTPTPQDMERAVEIQNRWLGDSRVDLVVAIAQAIADERERCAKVCDSEAGGCDVAMSRSGHRVSWTRAKERLQQCAAAIRSGGDHAS